jgi:hypothetical protein
MMESFLEEKENIFKTHVLKIHVIPLLRTLCFFKFLL